jgi:nitroimidazol reductase NimA-like FMN-containing flavoprotein (pyridoxamine 5'-phosphate oxidase superfamily)
MGHWSSTLGDVTGPVTDHAGLQTLSLDTCLHLLRSVPVGRVAFPWAGEVLILPVNHVVDGQDVVFQTTYGAKLTASQQGRPVTFEVDAFDGGTHSGWSVVVEGVPEPVEDDEEIRRLRQAGLRSWVDAGPSMVVRIRPTSVTGRRISS